MAKSKHLSPNLEAVRAEAYEQAADVVSNALVGVGPTELGRRLGRDMRRTTWVLQQGDHDATLSTLSDIAFATGRRLRIVMEPK